MPNTVDILKVAKAEVEWNYPLDYQIAIDDAIECVEIVDRLEKLIPQNTPYCYTPIGFEGDIYKTKPCPYWDITTINDPQYGERSVEWCHYLGKELYIQDQVKDCGIGDPYEEELEQDNEDKDPMDIIYCAVNKPCETCPKYPDECVDK